jgi:hypothetical protein
MDKHGADSALLAELQGMFPQLPLHTIQSALQTNDDAINALLEIQTSQERYDT